MTIGVVGAGTMGRGIAQVAATTGHRVLLYDNQSVGLQAAMQSLTGLFDKLVAKEKISRNDADAILQRIEPVDHLDSMEPCNLIIEAIVENLGVKQQLFSQLETFVDEDCILASNTSSLSIASLAGPCDHPERFIGIHFFNPAALMPLVEVIPALQTSPEVLQTVQKLIADWGKVVVVTKDTPGFIVNRVARPFYGEAIRIYEEGIADMATIDWAMKTIGGFRMGPFELMDYIGNDINYTVTETVYEAFFYDPRYRPSFTQKRVVEARRLGRKSGMGYYDYREGAEPPAPTTDEGLGHQIVNRIVAMLINEAADALFWNIASARDIDLAMTKGVNYPKGLLAWADELGVLNVYNRLESLYEEYAEDRYRPSPLLRRMARENHRFYS
ncbi:MAG: 3-hydroxybutyryl-CoA dehydrogenase [Cryomorphaceae bacterium]|nr:MAG: 3-hydroxybutyryl-CoA dehydrogenase [Cryomorphaceae bacterium]